MQSRKINFELQGRVRKYLKYTMFHESNVEKEEYIINKLTDELKKEVILESNGKFLFNTEIFSKNFSAHTLQSLAFMLKQRRYSPEEFIYHVIFFIFNLSFYLSYIK